MSDKEYNNILDIVRDAQNGIDGSFDALYSVSYPYAYGAASALLKSREDIEDALQMAFHYVSRYIKDLKTPEAYLKWLNRIVINECKKILIEQNKHHKIFFAEKKRLMMVEEAEMIEADKIEKADLVDTVNRIIDGMKPEKSEILKLYYFERLSYDEISKKLGIPIGTVMSRLHNAKKELEKKVKELRRNGTILWSFPVLPLVAALLSYNIKAEVPAAILGKAVAGTAAVSSAGAASVSTATATAAVSGTAASGAASAAAAAGTSVAVKAVAVAVAATVTVGGGITAKRVIEKQTAAVEMSITENSKYTSRISLSENDIELTKPISESETDKETKISESSSESVLSKAKTTTEVKAADTTAKSGEKQESVIVSEKQASETTHENRTKRSENTTSTTSPSTATTQKQNEKTTQPTTSASTTQKPTETTSKKPTTADPSAGLSVSGGVLNGYSGSGGAVNIPSTVNGQAVKAIGAGAFEGANITSVSIPSSVTKIGQTAFSDCARLTSVSLPSTLTSIGDCAFDGCSSLNSITIPSSVTNIGDSAFDGCNDLKIRCSEGSAAHDYAVENGIDYELI